MGKKGRITETISTIFFKKAVEVIAFSFLCFIHNKLIILDNTVRMYGVYEYNVSFATTLFLEICMRLVSLALLYHYLGSFSPRLV